MDVTAFTGWKQWNEQSVRKLDLVKTRYVVTVDVAGFFENVSLAYLRSELIRIGSANDVVELIMRCLYEWVVVRERGLPQGILASDVLAKLYLESFDKRMKDEGHTHMRYVDDVRIYCRSESQARRALVHATELLRERGLTVQSAKTGIRPVDDVLRAEFAGALPAIQALRREYIDEVLDAGILPESEESIPVSVIDDLVSAEPTAIDPEVIRRAFKQFVIDEERPNRSMFNFLLHRLAAWGDHFAVDYCAKRLRTHPDSPTEILRYFEDLNDPHTLEGLLAKALGSKELDMYPYMRFLILEWLQRNSSAIRAPTLVIVRKQAFDSSSPTYVQAAARAVLGQLGDHSDLDRMAGLLRSSADPLQRAQLLCCISRLEKGRRNALVGRLAKEEPWGARAAALVKGAG